MKDSTGISRGFEYLYRAPYGTPEGRGAPPPVYSRSLENDMLIERNVKVRMRDGIELCVDVFRPPEEKPAPHPSKPEAGLLGTPPIIAWTPYGKHQNGSGIYDANPACEVKPGMVSHYATFEGPDPAYWVPRGYAVVNADIRGTWYSQGIATLLSPEEAHDFYDLIEWAGTQSWSNGKVGLSGVSYLSQLQWRVAELHPPHLAAMNIWEGFSDTYREVARHGGIPDNGFWTARLADSWGCSSSPRIEDLVRETQEHPWFDAFWASKAADLPKINAPAFVVACWADQGLHLRGTVKGFEKIASSQKWLLVHGRKKWAHYYQPENVKLLQDFFDYFLKGLPSPVTQWPKVRLEAREKYFVGGLRDENEWPIARTEYRKLYLDAKHGAMQSSPLLEASSCRYNAMGSGPGAHRAEFEIAFAEPTELIGHMKLKIFMTADGADDMDIFVGLYKFDAHDNFVPFAFYAFFDDGPVALGWLRASHRELDREKSTEHQPVLAHQRELKLKPGEIVPLDIEVWPSGTRFEAGEKLKLIVQGTDLQKYSKAVAPIYYRHEDTVNRGSHVVHAGGQYDSHLLVPVIPPKPR